MAQNNVIGSEELDEFVLKLNVVIDGEKKIQDLEERRQVLLEELSWFALTQDGIFDEDIHRDLLSEADRQIVDETSRVNEARE